MNLNMKAFIRALGVLMMIMGATMVLPLIVSVMYHESHTALSFIGTIIPTSAIGLILYRKVIPAQNAMTVRDGYLTVSVCWILASLISAIPFVLSGAIPNIFDAFFECSSSLTTTGASALSDVESLPQGILFWRAFTNWLGGMGILVFAAAVLPSLGINANILAATEAPGPTMDKIKPKISDSAKNLYIIYTIFTVAEIILLMLAGMNIFDAATHTFGSVGTGGFSNYNNSIAHFNSAPIEMIITAFMILSGVNFNLYFYSFKRQGGIRNLLADEEFKVYIIIIAVVSALISVNLWLSHTYQSWGQAFRFSIFQTASILTTTGSVSADYDFWPTFSKMLIFTLMFIGGCSSSTAGGVKVVRFLVIFKLIIRSIQVRLHPNAIISIKINDKKLSIDTVSEIANFMFLHILVVAVSTLIVSLDGYDIITNFSAVLTCIGNIGPGFNLVGPSMNFSIFSNAVKFLLSFVMLAGRLELYAFIVLFMPRFWQQNK
ncbi:TrkH family potassium uptake protein [Aminipila luticellarii]|uniref:TrkH family potassium uptake protein n=1 Tax=Aminipila luticellarii TaxID=2507160 RepID=A0A410PW93_9FIRM|nr:TrkH family potassium uptake protein [Aminipila luticellarii]QAT43212.1 TrkH family potassium uptake protein [Aminipila luticellarii]